MRLSSIVPLPPSIQYFPREVDTDAEVSGLFRAYCAQMGGTGRTLFIDSGTYYHDLTDFDINGFYVVAAPDAVIASTRKAGGRVKLTGERCGIEGGIWQQEYCRSYTVTAAAVAGNVATLTVPGHPFAVGDHVGCHNITGLGSINEVDKTVTVVNGDDISFAHTNSDASGTVSSTRNDLHNTAESPILATVAMLRSASDDDNVIYAWNASRFHLRNVTVRYSRSCALMIHNCSEGLIHSFAGSESQSDGLHITNQSNRLEFTGHTRVTRSGDSAFAMVGYRVHKRPLTDINVQHLEVRDLLHHGTGLDIIGVERLHIDRLVADNIYFAGINEQVDTGTYYTWGNKDVRIEHATVRTAGNDGAVPSGWETTPGAAVIVGGGSNTNTSDHLKARNVSIGLLEIFNARWRPINDTAARNNVQIDRLHVIGGAAVSVVAPDSWRVGSMLLEEQTEIGIAVGGANARGLSALGDIEVRHVNNGAPLQLASASCDGTTVTFVTTAAHGLSGTPNFRTAGITSDHSTPGSGSTSSSQQNKDYALNANWHTALWTATTNYTFRNRVSPTTPNGFLYHATLDTGSSGASEPTWPTTIGATVVDGGITWTCIAPPENTVICTGVSFPDANTIALTGTGLAATVAPLVYDPRAPIPKARLYKGGTASNDVMQILSGTPAGSFEVKSLRLTDQFLPVERIVEGLAADTAAARIYDVSDSTRLGSSMTGLIPDGYVRNLSSTVDSSDYLQRALTVAAGGAAAADTVVVVRLYPGSVVRLDYPVTVDIGRVLLDLQGSRLDCSNQGTSGGGALLLKSTLTAGGTVGADGWGQLAQGGVINGRLYGPGESGTTYGIKYDQTGTGSPDATSVRCRLANLSIDNFGRGEWYGKNSYLIHHYNCELSRCAVAAYVDSSATNAGENIAYHGGAIYNHTVGFEFNSSLRITCYGTSLDYVQKLVDNNSGGELELRDCHVEFGASGGSRPVSWPFIDMGNGASRFSMRGGKYLGVQASGVPTATEHVLCNHAQQEVEFDGVEFRNCDLSGNVLVNGTARRVRVRNSTSPDWTKMPALSHYSSSSISDRVADPKFAGTVLQDQWTILDDNGVPTERYSGANVDFMDSGGVNQAPWFDLTNDRLIIARTNATAAKVGLLVRMREAQERFGVMVKYSASPTPGTLDINTYYTNRFAGLQNTTPAAGEPVVPEVFRDTATMAVVANDVTPPGAGSEATVYAAATVLPPAARDTFVLELDLGGIATGKNVYLKEVRVTPW